MPLIALQVVLQSLAAGLWAPRIPLALSGSCQSKRIYDNHSIVHSLLSKTCRDFSLSFPFHLEVLPQRLPWNFCETKAYHTFAPSTSAALCRAFNLFFLQFILRKNVSRQEPRICKVGEFCYVGVVSPF
jgi:hypothetical protein